MNEEKEKNKPYAKEREERIRKNAEEISRKLAKGKLVVDLSGKPGENILEVLDVKRMDKAMDHVEKTYEKGRKIAILDRMSECETEKEAVLCVLRPCFWKMEVRENVEVDISDFEDASLALEELLGTPDTGFSILAVTGTDNKRSIIGLMNCDNPMLEDFSFKGYTKTEYATPDWNQPLNTENLRYQVKRFIKQNDLNEMYDYLTANVIGQEKSLRLFSLSVYLYLKAIAEDRPCTNNNILITGPSGSGKSESIRVLMEYFRIKNFQLPVVRVDLGEVTPNGYRGKESDEILVSLMEKNDSLAGYGIVAIDEFDKKCVPYYCDAGDDSNKETQGQLLNMIEGMEFDLEVTDEKGKTKIMFCDTNHTLFIGMGSFSGLRDEEEHESTKPKLGFSFGKEEEKKKIVFDEVDIDDCIEYGMIPELAGRFGLLLHMTRIPLDSMCRIVRKKMKELEKELEVKIELSSDCFRELVDSAYTKLGIRGLTNKLRQSCLTAIAEGLVIRDENPDSFYDLDNPRILHLESLRQVKLEAAL